MSIAKPAATVMVLRQGAKEPELILLKRSRKVGFFPSAWVFPGGRVDDLDSEFPSIGDAHDGVGKEFAVAAIRECFEEAGYWLGQGKPDSALRGILNRREGYLPLDGSLVADLNQMRQWAWWITPETEPRRYDTRFFLCCVDDEQEISHDNEEAVESCWISPREAVKKHEAEEMFVAPPTYVTLLELMKYSHVEEIWEAANNRVIAPILPTHFKGNGELEIRLPGHPEHPITEKALEWSKFVLRDGRWLGFLHS